MNHAPSIPRRHAPGLALAVAVALLLAGAPTAPAADSPRPQMKNLLALSGAQARLQPPATPAPNSLPVSVPEPVALPGVPASVFNDDPGTGIDPFFPASRRRPSRLNPAPAPAPATQSHTPTLTAVRPEPPRVLPPAVNLILRGIVGPAYRRLALISTTTRTFDVKAGEEISLRAGSADLRVTCVQIRENSVVVRVEGETADRELQLKDGI